MMNKAFGLSAPKYYFNNHRIFDIMEKFRQRHIDSFKLEANTQPRRFGTHSHFGYMSTSHLNMQLDRI